MDQTHMDHEPEARGPQDFDRRFSDGLGAVFDGFSFSESEPNQGLGREAPKHRFKTDKPSTGTGRAPREARELREESAPVQLEQRWRRFLARTHFFRGEAPLLEDRCG